MPPEIMFSKTHEWAKVLDEARGKVAAVGLSAYAYEQLTDLVHLELPDIGRRVKAGEPFGEVESVKAVSDIYSPVDGEVVEVNAAAVQNLDRLARDPYGAGWLIKVKLDSNALPEGLLDEAAYKKHCDSEQH